mgnify:FL=1
MKWPWAREQAKPDHWRQAKPACPHDDWTVDDSNGIGRGTCLKCGEELVLSDLLRRWKTRIEKGLIPR